METSLNECRIHARMWTGRWRKWRLSFCFQELRGELLRSAAVHRLPAGSGLEVDPRAQRVSRQLLLGAVPVPPQRWHHAQLGESLLHTFTNVALTRVTLFHGKNERECEECPSCSLQYNKWNGKTCPKMHHKQRFRLKTKPLSLRPICLEIKTLSHVTWCSVWETAVIHWKSSTLCLHTYKFAASRHHIRREVSDAKWHRFLCNSYLITAILRFKSFKWDLRATVHYILYNTIMSLVNLDLKYQSVPHKRHHGT